MILVLRCSRVSLWKQWMTNKSYSPQSILSSVYSLIDFSMDMTGREMACAALSSLLLIKWREISSALLSWLNLMSVIQIVLLEL